MSLIELMVALTIGLIILAALSTVFVNSKSSYTTQESMARLQESARFAMHFITRDLRMAGYYGCAGDIGSIENLLNDVAAAEPYDFSISIEGNEAGTGAFYPSGKATTISFPSAGTFVKAKHAGCPDYVGGRCTGADAIAIRRADPDGAVGLTNNMPNTSAAAFVADSSGLEIGDIVLLSDCASGVLFQITNIQQGGGGNAIVHNTGAGSPGNSTQSFSRPFDTNAQIMQIIHRVYYVGTGKSGHPALFRQGIDGSNREELVDGIENLQVTFGVDKAGDRTPRAYRNADHADLFSNNPTEDKKKWANVISTRVVLTARSVVNTTDTTTANRNEVKSQDFTSTVLLRNLQ